MLCDKLEFEVPLKFPIFGNIIIPERLIDVKASEAANQINRRLEQVMPLLTPLGVILGAVLSGVFLHLRPFVTLLFAIMTLAGAVKLRARELGKAVASPVPLLLFFSTAHVLIPVMVYLLSGLIFRNDPDTVSGYVLLYSSPTAVAGFIWVSIFRGDPALSLALILVDTILAPLVVPGTVRLLLGSHITLNMTGIAVSLIYMVVIPTIAGVALNELSRGKIPALVNPYLTPLSKICMILVISANTAAVASQFQLDNPHLWIIAAFCIGFSVLSFTGAKFACLAAKLGREKQISLFFASGLRNTSAAMTLAIEYFPGPAALPAVLGIMFQQTIAAFMGRLFLGKREDREQ